MQSDDQTRPLRTGDGEGRWDPAFVRRVESAGTVVLLTDFDGTVAEIREDPEAVTIRPDARTALAALADCPRTQIAVVSGRALEDLRGLVGLEGIGYAGNHGLEIELGDRVFVHPTARRATDDIERVCRSIRDRLGDIEGMSIEDKGLTATVHYRPVSDRSTIRRIREGVRAIVTDEDAIRVHDGRQIVELRPAVEWDKGRAVEWLLEKMPGTEGTRLPIYVGDDTTDEAAFEAVGTGGIGIAVGREPAETSAGFVLGAPSDVSEVYGWLAAR